MKTQSDYVQEYIWSLGSDDKPLLWGYWQSFIVYYARINNRDFYLLADGINVRTADINETQKILSEGKIVYLEEETNGKSNGNQ